MNKRMLRQLYLQFVYFKSAFRCMGYWFKKKDPSRFPHYLSIVAIVKNEAPYIAEWIEYHLLQGVTKFYIYDNESEDNLLEVLAPYVESEIVEYIYCPGMAKQSFAYNDILDKARKETYWLAVIDLDEFIVPVSVPSLSEFLKDFGKYPGIEINWLMYGSSGHKNQTDGLVIERFKYHSFPDFAANRHVKSIINPRFVIRIEAHSSVYFGMQIPVNPDKEKITQTFLKREGSFDKLIINHYYGKSHEEFLKKRQRGNVAYAGLISLETFHAYDRNEIKNDPVVDKYIPLIYRNLELRYKNGYKL